MSKRIEVNAKGKTHFEHMEKYVTYQKCSASDMTFGGRCLNCGWVADHYLPLLTDQEETQCEPKN
jgi:hypothetical protein